MNDLKIETGTVNIRGREYRTVALRLNEFRSLHPDWAIETELVSMDEKTVVMRAVIKDDTGRVISTGYAEESRTSSPINKTSALENCETSAVGRCLAFYGLAGSEIASADEVAAAIAAQNRPSADLSAEIKALETAGDMDALMSAWKAAYSKHQGDSMAIERLTRVKDNQKRVLSVAEAMGGKVQS